MQLSFFFSEYFKESPEKTSAFFLTFMVRRNSTIAIHHVLVITFYAVTLQKPFFTDRIKKFDFFKATHFQTLNIIYIKLIYI